MRIFSFQFVGNALFAFSLAAIILMYNPHYQSLYAQEIKVFFDTQNLDIQPQKISKAAKIETENLSYGQIKEEAGRWGVDSFFSVVVPKISAAANVIMDVDPLNKDAYEEALKKGVAHAKGTSFPGRGKMVYLFAHSTDSLANVVRFNAVFFRLHELEAGDEIIVFYADRKYTYKVLEKHIVEPDDTSWLNHQGDILILQTCWPPGTSSKRLLVLAKPS